MLLQIIKMFFLLILLSTPLYSQELYLCESYTEDGSPIGPLNKLEIRPYGTAVYILLDNETEFGDPILYLFIDKLVDNKYMPYDSKTINVKVDDNWAVTSFEFKEPGNYEVYFLNSSQNKLATNKVSTYFADAFVDQVLNSTFRSTSGCELIFCELVINGNPVNPFSSFSLSKFGNQAFIYLNNYADFGIDTIKVQVWRRSNVNTNYEELIDSKKYKIFPEWSDTFFRYNFVQIGEFKIDVFDQNDNFISSNIITITN